MKKKSVLFTSFLISCVASLHAQEIKYAAALIPDSIKKGANVVCQLDEAVLDVESPGHYSYKVHDIYTILNKEGAGYLYKAFGINKYNSVDDINIKTYNALGIETGKYKKKDFVTTAAYDGFSLITDELVMRLRITENNFPCTIDISYTEDARSYINLPPWYFQNYNQYMELSRITVKIPKSMGLRYKIKNIDKTPVITSQDNKDVYVWEVKNLKPSVPEAGSGKSNNIPVLNLVTNQFSCYGYKGEFKDWDTYGKWTYPLFEESKNPFSDARRKEIQELVKDAKTDNEKIDILYKHMQKNFRYVSIQLGIGGFKPFPVSFVDEKKYGDCKALSNYMRYLLKEVGIKSYPAIIRAEYDADEMDKDFPYDYFNHVILCVPRDRDTVWLECTSKTTDFNVLGTFTENRYALLVTENGGVLVPTPKSKASDNVSRLYTTVHLEETGAAKCETSINASGEYKEMYNHFLDEKKDDQKEFLVKYLGFKQPDYFNYSQNDKTPGFNVNLTLEVEKVPEFTAGSKMFLNPQIYKSMLESKLPSAENRKEDYYFEYPYRETDTTAYKLPEGFVVDMLPAAHTLSCSYGNFNSKYWYNEADKTVYSTASLELNKNRIPAGSYKEVKTFFDSVGKESTQRIVIKKQ